ncbi:hypothetical protein, partial [Thiolapillus sp.]|uniref:hypothetical protein n=1 Tax=Thiolapillus sp. TaxID=2017437 RepID=UPI00273A0D1B
RSEAYFVFPLAQGTPGKQCGLAATGVYQPSLRSPWLAADDVSSLTSRSSVATAAIRRMSVTKSRTTTFFLLGASLKPLPSCCTNILLE